MFGFTNRFSLRAYAVTSSFKFVFFLSPAGVNKVPVTYFPLGSESKSWFLRTVNKQNLKVDYHPMHFPI